MKLLSLSLMPMAALSAVQVGHGAKQHAGVERAVTGLPGRAELSPLLRTIADWILTTNVESNNITNNKDTLSTSIFINGNLARVLLAAHTIFDHNATYLEAGLGWCDTLVSLQHLQATHDGRAGAAGWWDTGYHELFIADTGTAVTALALCYDLAQETEAKVKATTGERSWDAAAQAAPSRADTYLESMLRFADFVVNGTQSTPVCDFSPGCAYDAAGHGSETTSTWLVSEHDPSSPDFGALGDGYYKGTINLMPYTISTATTGGAFFAELAGVLERHGKQPDLVSELKGYARGSASWLLENVQPNGTIPYFINPPDPAEHTYQCTSYSTEAIVDTDLRGIAPIGDNSTSAAQAAGRMVEYLLSQQQENGELIGKNASFGEQQRSPRAVSLLQWWYDRTEDPATASAVHAYVDFLNNELHNTTSEYGLCEYALVTGFVGLAAADLIEPWCTFSRGLSH